MDDSEPVDVDTVEQNLNLFEAGKITLSKQRVMRYVSAMLREKEEFEAQEKQFLETARQIYEDIRADDAGRRVLANKIESVKRLTTAMDAAKALWKNQVEELSKEFEAEMTQMQASIDKVTEHYNHLHAFLSLDPSEMFDAMELPGIDGMERSNELSEFVRKQWMASKAKEQKPLGATTSSTMTASPFGSTGTTKDQSQVEPQLTSGHASAHPGPGAYGSFPASPGHPQQQDAYTEVASVSGDGTYNLPRSNLGFGIAPNPQSGYQAAPSSDPMQPITPAQGGLERNDSMPPQPVWLKAHCAFNGGYVPNSLQFREGDVVLLGNAAHLQQEWAWGLGGGVYGWVPTNHFDLV